MMKKRPIAYGVVALALILMGTGYAYWTDTLNVTTRATTGDMEVTFADLGIYAQYSNEMKSGYWSVVDGVGETGFIPADYFYRGENYNEIAANGSIDQYYADSKGYHNATFDAKLVDPAPISGTVGPYNPANTNGSDKIEIDVNGMYPGYAQAFRTDILNVGSIAAKLSDMKFTVTGLGNDFAFNNNIQSLMGVAIYVEREYQEGNIVVPVFKLCESLKLPADSFFTVGGVQFVRLSALTEDTVAEALTNTSLLVDPNENRMDFYLGIAMDPDAEGNYTTGTAAEMTKQNDKMSQNAGVKLSIDLLWDQFNAGVNVDGGNHLANQNG